MKRSIYIAGSSHEIERVRCAYALLEEQPNFELVYDWTQAIEERAARGLGDGDLTQTDADRYAERDLLAILCADVFWLLQPAVPSQGAFFEAGFAYALHRMHWPTPPQPAAPWASPAPWAPHQTRHGLFIVSEMEGSLPSIFVSKAALRVARDTDVFPVLTDYFAYGMQSARALAGRLRAARGLGPLAMDPFSGG